MKKEVKPAKTFEKFDFSEVQNSNRSRGSSNHTTQKLQSKIEELEDKIQELKQQLETEMISSESLKSQLKTSKDLFTALDSDFKHLEHVNTNLLAETKRLQPFEFLYEEEKFAKL